jgi:hypothetical protein
MILLLAAVCATASATAADARKASKPAGDGGNLVCRKLATIGTRLGQKRICMTREEWADQKRLQRAELERAQVWRGRTE